MNKRIETLKGVSLDDFNTHFTMREQADAATKMLVYQPPPTSPFKSLRPIRWFEAVTLETTHQQVETFHIYRDNETKKYVVVIVATYYHINRLEIAVKWEDWAAEYADNFFTWLDKKFEHVTDDKAEVERKNTLATATPAIHTSVEFKPEHRHIHEDKLTDRENEVLTLALEGLGRREISKKLCIEVRTVDTNAQKICEKMGFPETTKTLSKVRQYYQESKKSG